MSFIKDLTFLNIYNFGKEIYYYFIYFFINSYIFLHNFNFCTFDTTK